MDLIALAIPFFLLALLLEIAVDRIRGTGFYRANDSVNSLSVGTLSTTFGYFTNLLPAIILAYILQNLSLFDVDLAWFDFSPGGILLWALALLAFDFCYYWAHRFGHEISVLWAAHAVHHQSEDYNLSTALRQTSTGFLFSWVFYLPLFLLGMPFEVFVTVNALDLIYQFWVHTQLVGKLGWLDRVLVTPSNHRVHHAQNAMYIDKNYGGILILWDRMFGTFQEELDDQPVIFGVRKPLANWNPLWANFQVYSYLWFDAVRTKNWKDKIGVWFRRTGWRPHDVEESHPKISADLSAFEKYDPPLHQSLQRYVVVNLVLGAIAVLGIGLLFAASGAFATLIPCIALWITLLSLGFLSDLKHYAIRVEFIRIFLVVPLSVLAMVYFEILPDGLVGMAALGTIFFVLISVILLIPAARSFNKPV